MGRISSKNSDSWVMDPALRRNRISNICIAADDREAEWHNILVPVKMLKCRDVVNEKGKSWENIADCLCIQILYQLKGDEKGEE